MKALRPFLILLAIPLMVAGVNLLTGQNFYYWRISPESNAIYLGAFMELLALAIIFQSRERWAVIFMAVLLFIAALLLLGWGVIVAMYSGWGDGASRGAGFTDVLACPVAAIGFIAGGIYSIRHSSAFATAKAQEYQE